MRDTTCSGERSKNTSAPSALAAVEILIEKIRSSTAQRIIGVRVTGTREMILEIRAAPPFHKNSFVVGCERTREAVRGRPGDEVIELLAAVATHLLDVTSSSRAPRILDRIGGLAATEEALAAPSPSRRSPALRTRCGAGAGARFPRRTASPSCHFSGFTVKCNCRFGDYEVRVHHTPGHSPEKCVSPDGAEAPAELGAQLLS